MGTEWTTKEALAGLAEPTVAPCEWDGGTGYVRMMDAGGRAAFFAYPLDEGEAEAGRAAKQQIAFVRSVLCDPAGNRVFEDTEDDWQAVSKLPHGFIDAAQEAGYTLNGMDAEAVESAEGN